MKKITYEDLLYRIGYFRNKNNLSARETSLRMGLGDAYINRIERNVVEMKVKTLLDFFDLVEINGVEFFYPNLEEYEKDKELIEILSTLSKDSKQTLIDLAKKLK